MARTRDDDACPSELQAHQAADGALVRVRLPDGAITAAQLNDLAHTAARFGNDTLELTSRASLQLRGIQDVPPPSPRRSAPPVTALPDARMGSQYPRLLASSPRRLVASPLSGRAGGLADVRPRVAELDTALQGDAQLAGLPGRFWFSLDDGCGDVSGLHAAAGIEAIADDTAALPLAARTPGCGSPSTTR